MEELISTLLDGNIVSVLAEGNNSNENSKRIIKTIGDIGTKKKVKFISNLTRACYMKYIEISKFFELSQCIVRLTEEDLEFINDNISNNMVTEDEEYIDDFRNCGLLKEVEGGFTFTKRAYELIKFSLNYENNIDIPECIQKRLITEAATSEDIDRIIEGVLELGVAVASVTWYN